MTGLQSRKTIAGASVLFGLGAMIAASVALATHVAGSQPAEVIVVRTVAPDAFDSGWHTHPGPAIVPVEEGQFRIYQGSCAPKIVGRGETYIEVPSVPVRAVSKAAITWTTTLVVPDSLPPRTNVGDACD